MTEAARIIGAAACFKKDRSLALEQYRRLDQKSRQFLVYVCGRNAIVIP